MRVCQEIAVVSLLIASPACAFAPTVHRQSALANKDVSYLTPEIHSPLQLRDHSTSLFAKEETTSDATTRQAPSKEIDLLEEANAIFDSVDANKDGVISSEELRSHLCDQMGYSADYTNYLFASLDTDDDGVITKEEFRYAFYNFEALSMYMTFGVGGSEVTSREAFKAFALNKGVGGGDKLLLDDLADLIFDMIDTDKSGEISKVELRAHFDNVTDKFDDEESTENQAKDYVRTMFATFDANDDGTIDRKEIRAAFQKYDFKLLAQTFGLRVYRQAEV